jgi:hypothetical protein
MGQTRCIAGTKLSCRGKGQTLISVNFPYFLSGLAVFP